MLLARDVEVSLQPEFKTLVAPFWTILNQWLLAGFDRQACELILRRMIEKHSLIDGLFFPEAVRKGQVVVGEQILYPKPGDWRLIVTVKVDGRPVEVTKAIQQEDLKEAAEWIRWLTTCENRQEMIDELGPFGDQVLAKLLTADSSRPWPSAQVPGIYRREHATLVIRSQTTSLLLDPICLLGASLPHIDKAPYHVAKSVDGVIITHGHGDHWHLPSILQATRNSAVPVLVPRVPKTSFLTPEQFDDSLRRTGQSVQCPEWYSSMMYGDILVDVLPFYGEQPTRDGIGPHDNMRSWGNCYRFNTPDFSALVLVDSGTDPAGSMVDVARKSFEARGPVDVVLSCLRTFACPFFGGLSDYWVPLSFERLEDLYAAYRVHSLPSTTAGPDGSAEICETAHARYYLPYANGFEGVGQSIKDIGWGLGEPSEAERLEETRRALQSLDADTQAVPWNPGDMARFIDGRLEIIGSTSVSAHE